MREFEEILKEAIDLSLDEVFGKDTAKAVRFYVDTSIALKDISYYEKVLRGIFLDGADLIIDKIGKNLSKRINFEWKKGMSLKEVVELAKKFFSQQS